MSRARRAKRTRRGWRATGTLPAPNAGRRSPAPTAEFRWCERLLEALGELDEDDRVEAIRELGAGDQAALAELGDRLGIGPPPERPWT